MADSILLKSGHVLFLDSFPELSNQHLPKVGDTTGSPLWIYFRKRFVYFSARREKKGCFTVIQSDDVG